MGATLVQHRQGFRRCTLVPLRAYCALSWTTRVTISKFHAHSLSLDSQKDLPRRPGFPDVNGQAADKMPPNKNSKQARRTVRRERDDAKDAFEYKRSRQGSEIKDIIRRATRLKHSCQCSLQLTLLGDNPDFSCILQFSESPLLRRARSRARARHASIRYVRQKQVTLSHREKQKKSCVNLVHFTLLERASCEFIPTKGITIKGTQAKPREGLDLAYFR